MEKPAMDDATRWFLNAWVAMPGEEPEEDILALRRPDMPPTLLAWLEAYAHDDGVVCIGNWWFETEVVRPLPELLAELGVATEEISSYTVEGAEEGAFDLAARALVVASEPEDEEHLVALWREGEPALSLALVRDDQVEASVNAGGGAIARLLGPFPAVLRELAASQDPEMVDETLRPLIGEQLPAAELVEWYREAPPHPWEEAQACFERFTGLLVAGPTPEGRHLLARRPKGVEASLVVLGADDSEVELDWAEDADLFDLCLIPGTERVLFCAGPSDPGPTEPALFEIDLATGLSRKRSEGPCLACAFLDEETMAVLSRGSLFLYPSAEADIARPIASAPCPGASALAVAAGRLWTKLPGGLCRGWRWDGRALIEAIDLPFPERFAAHELIGAGEMASQPLLAALDPADPDGVAIWLRILERQDPRATGSSSGE